MKKKALIFGATGQDGSYLIEFLLKKKINQQKMAAKPTNNQLVQDYQKIKLGLISKELKII